jgi:Polyketide cyclase / dehydrase and lipid transport
MASIHQDIRLGVTPDQAWAAVRDFGAVHERVAPGFVIDTRRDGDDRIVTFHTGATARERLVTIDDTRRRLVYTVVHSQLGLVHHQAAVEVVDAGESGCRLVWTADVLPDTVEPVVNSLMEQGAAAIGRALAG